MCEDFKTDLTTYPTPTAPTVHNVLMHQKTHITTSGHTYVLWNGQPPGQSEFCTEGVGIWPQDSTTHKSNHQNCSLTKQNGESIVLFESAREEFQMLVPLDFWWDMKKDYWMCNVKVCKQKQFKSRTIEKSSHITTALWNCSLDDGTTKIIEGSSSHQSCTEQSHGWEDTIDTCPVTTKFHALKHTSFLCWMVMSPMHHHAQSYPHTVLDTRDLPIHMWFHYS